MTTFYLICFTLGLSLTVLSALGAFTHLHIGHVHLHLHPGHGGGHTHVHVGGAQAAGKASVSPVNGFTLAAFLCWFGGCGYLLARSHDFGMGVVLALATITGGAGGALLFWFLVKVLLPHEKELTAADTDILGILGLVTGPIRESGTGEIQFSQNGTRRFATARSEAGVALPRGTEVVVMRYEQGIAYVRPWDELSGEVVSDSPRIDASAPAATSTPFSPDGKDQAL
ncbi:MAG TPA: NfeD family protein [Acidobacteriaceae bacterium]|jgi:membrane protein implicated in regulation of membrane protease activity|nr:NfeD family protein [Acidobacteriaceae bacterium]